jgi:hypothetical protein
VFPPRSPASFAILHCQFLRGRRAVRGRTGRGRAAATGSAFQDNGGRTCRFLRQTAMKGSQTPEDTVKLRKGSTGWVPAGDPAGGGFAG